eukprot:227714-Rhodomonas_salina.2
MAASRFSASTHAVASKLGRVPASAARPTSSARASASSATRIEGTITAESWSGCSTSSSGARSEWMAVLVVGSIETKDLPSSLHLLARRPAARETSCSQQSCAATGTHLTMRCSPSSSCPRPRPHHPRQTAPDTASTARMERGFPSHEHSRREQTARDDSERRPRRPWTCSTRASRRGAWL